MQLNADTQGVKGALCPYAQDFLQDDEMTEDEENKITIDHSREVNKMKDTKDITDYFHKDWKKYLESEEGKEYLEEINKNYNNYLNGKE